MTLSQKKSLLFSALYRGYKAIYGGYKAIYRDEIIQLPNFVGH